MLVGEHGRVIPFRRFKMIAGAIIVLASLSLGALAIIGYLYAQQTGTVSRLQREVDAFRRQTAQLKDEKDVLQAKLVLFEMQKEPVADQRSKGKETLPSPQKPAMLPSTPAPATESEPATAAPTPTSTPGMNWTLDLQQFSTEYDARRELMKFTIRIVNNTKSKQPFSGRMVMVLKKSGLPSQKWISLPKVPLKEGRPTGKEGQGFVVQNARTLDFRLNKQRSPRDYDTATIFVFLNDGELLMSRDFNFDGSTQLPAPVKNDPPAAQPQSQQPETTNAPAAPVETIAPLPATQNSPEEAPKR